LLAGQRDSEIHPCGASVRIARSAALILSASSTHPARAPLAVTGAAAHSPATARRVGRSRATHRADRDETVHAHDAPLAEPVRAVHRLRTDRRESTRVPGRRKGVK